jgi:hypothetical protein
MAACCLGWVYPAGSTGAGLAEAGEVAGPKTGRWAGDHQFLGALISRLRKNPDDPQYFGVSGTLRTLLVVLNLPFSAAC